MKESTLALFVTRNTKQTWLVKCTESKHQKAENGAETKLRTKLEVDIIFKLLMEAQKDFK